MNWKYSISSHTLSQVNDNGEELVVSTSGWAGQPPYKNDPNGISVHGVGPLPPGWYTITAPYNNPKTGPYTMNLIPDSSNQMFGRSAFRIHGASISNPEYSSEGCMIQLKTVRYQVWNSGITRLQVVL